MRILVINYEYPPIGGGGGFVTRDILEYMAGVGHHVSVITSHYKGLERRECVNGVDIVRVPVFFRKEAEVANMPSMLCYLPMGILEGLMEGVSQRYDVINTHFAVPSGPAGYFLSKAFRIPNILTIHGGDIFDPSKSSSPHKTPVFRNIVQVMLRTADKVVAQSSDTKQNAYKYYKVNRDIDIIPLGIKKPLFGRKTRKELGFAPEGVLFCTIGRLVKRKNIDDTLFVLSSLREKLDFQFVVMGEGPEKSHLENLSKKLGLEASVLFLGNVSDELKFQVLDVSDMYLSTALHEGFGLVFLEAMECGLPILCYNRGGQMDFLVDGKTGYLAQLKDKEKFRQRLLEIISNGKLRERISRNNRQLVTNYYIGSCAEKYLSLFREVVGQSTNSC